MRGSGKMCFDPSAFHGAPQGICLEILRPAAGHAVITQDRANRSERSRKGGWAFRMAGGGACCCCGMAVASYLK
ncbi:hypothetical protein CHELA40_11513 [Chelatococcus asaccharovorans]|nr:hypothetical protein CHELA40_11513 [Chelatococcus asaccharovorans]CAH1684619.1 hypothetical protein CHELA17_64090 [Chelatococcus asaccharovorans]